MQLFSEPPGHNPGTAAATHARTRDRSTEDDRASLPDAAQSSPALSPTAPSPRKANRRHIRRQDSTISPPDRAVLLALARCRILSFDQLRRVVFPQLSPQRVGQRIQALDAGGWLDVWEDASRIGGRPRYALPTARALVLAHEALLASSAGTPTERIAALLLRARPRRPLVLAPRVTPAFLAHQRECNDLLIAYASIPGAKLLWSTSLDRPLPLAASHVALPQPDYLLVVDVSGRPTLIFGEHDRGHESLAHFRRTKAERYATLAARPEVVQQLFGFARFMVWVTVLDARAGAPLRRLAALVHVARNAAASDVMAFTLAGWAAVSPAAALWFCDGALPETTHLGTAKAQPGLRSIPTHPLLSAIR